MITMTTRSSTTARVSRNARSCVGRLPPTTASTASAKAMSVAAGIAQPPERRRRARHGVDGEVDAAGVSTPASGRDDGTSASAGLRSEPTSELALELQPGDVEEQRERAVGRPVLEVQRADLEVPQVVVRRRPRAVRPDDGDHGGDQDDGAADRLLRGAGRRGRSPRPRRRRGRKSGGAGVSLTGSLPGSAAGSPTRLPGTPVRPPYARRRDVSRLPSQGKAADN